MKKRGAIASSKTFARLVHFASALAVNLYLATTATAGFVYENNNEFLTSGDLNGDGVADVLVLDKLTGNVRVGFATAGGVISWSPPLVSGVENPSGCAVGRFLSATTDALAVTEPSFNRVNLLDLSNTNSPPVPTSALPGGIGPHSLVALDPPALPPPSGFASLLVASEWNGTPSEHLDLLNFVQGVASTGAFTVQNSPFERPNALTLTSNSFALAVGLVRDTNDTLLIWEFTNSPTIVAGLSNLPPGSDYVFGNFNGEALPRFIFFQPGGTNLQIVSLTQTGSGLAFGQALSVILAEPVQQVFYLQLGNDGAALLEFGDAIQGLSLPAGVATLSARFSSGTGAGGNVFSGIVPLAGGQFALMDAPIGSRASVHGQVLQFDGTKFTQLSSANLPALSSSSTRANVWLFQAEPFVNRDPGFVAALNASDWSDGITGLPGALAVVRETDAGPTPGLGSATTNNLGTPPNGSLFGIPNQYGQSISVFAYSPPRPAEPVIVTIAPPAGPYGSPINASFNVLNGGGVLYRVGSAAWQKFTGQFVLSNDVTVSFFGTNASLARSQIQLATYTFGGGSNGLPATPIDTVAGTTNFVPPLTTNSLILSADGTAFYGRRSAANAGSIWAINLDGSGDTFITSGARPRVTRDGRFMAFFREGNPFNNQGNVWLRDLQSGAETRLLVNTNTIVGMDWLPGDSKLIIDYSCGLWMLSTNGVLTPFLSINCADQAPAVNPVDGRIAFHNLNSDPSIGGIYEVAADGTGRQRVVTNLTVTGASWPQWSPDGQQLVLVDDSSGSLGNGTNLWIVDASGTNLVLITGFRDGTNHFQNGALWSRDGTTLVGAATIFGTNGLWLVPLTPDHTSCDCPPRLLPTTAGDPIDFAGSIVVAQSVPITPSGPITLFIRQEPNAVVVYWTTNSLGFSLEAAPNLSTSPAWGPVTGPIYSVGNFFEYWEPYGSLLNEKFFRLHFTGAPIAPKKQ